MATGAYPTGTMTTTTLANIIPEIWGAKMNDYYRAKLVTANFFTDLSSDIVGGGDTVYVPNITAMIAHTKTTASPVTVNANTDTNITLLVQTKTECSFAIEDMDSDQVKQSYGYIGRQAKNAAYEVAETYEASIIALFDNFSQTVGTSAAGVADSNIRAAIKYLDTANAPGEGRAFFFSPKAMWTDVMALDKFTLVQNTGGADPVTKGMVGTLYGIPVYVSSNIGTTLGSAQNCLAHKDAIVHANTGLKVQSNYVPQYLSTITTAFMRHGVVENRDTSGVWIKTAAA